MASGSSTIEIFAAYLTHLLDLLNGVTAFCVLQALVFVYWSQTDDFKDSMRFGAHTKFGAHTVACGVILLFAILYGVAIYIITSYQVDLISHLKDFDDPTFIKTKLTMPISKTKPGPRCGAGSRSLLYSI
jgi:hypothetical protein